MSENVDKVVIDPNTDDLNEFNKLISGEAIPATEQEETKDVETNNDNEESVDNLAPDNDEQVDEQNEEVDSDDEHDDDDDEAENDDDSKSSKKDKQSRFQKKINDLTAKRREAERKAENLEKSLNEILQKLKSDDKETSKTEQAPKEELKAPAINDKNEDGTDKYPLGEFDPKYIADLTKFSISKEMEAQRELLRKEQEQQKINEEKQILDVQWQGKLSSFTQENPEINLQEVGDSLENALQGIEPTYAQYLEDVIKSMDAGIEVLCYLGQNTEEAKKIIAMGPAKATVHLGRLESLFLEGSVAEQEKPKQPKFKPSKAPTPPMKVNKGASSAVKIDTNTDDLDAFSKLLFTK